MIKELNYDLTKKDVLKFLYFHNFKDNKLCIFLLLCLLIIIFYIITANLFVGLLLILYITVFLLILLSPCIKIMDHENTKLKVKLDTDKSAFILSGLMVFEYNWSHIKNIYNTKYNLLIYISKNIAVVIPKRIFESEQEMNETWELIQECYNKNREEKRS